MNNKYEAKWSGSYPNLCSGEWKLYKNGKDISDHIPIGLRDRPMRTRKTFHSVGFDKSWQMTCTAYEDGWFEGTWVGLNYHWICTIGDTPEDYAAIYRAFKAEDWRWSSCGGCL